MPKNNSVSDPLERIARLLAIAATKDIPDKEEAARRLLAAGFDSPMIGGLLDVGPNFANVAKSRKPKKKAKARACSAGIESRDSGVGLNERDYRH